MCAQLSEADEALREAQERCQAVEAKVNEMETELQQQIKEKEALQQEIQLCQSRLQRARFLTKGLAEEAVSLSKPQGLNSETLSLQRMHLCASEAISFSC